MNVAIIFQTNSTPAFYKNIDDVYTKGGLLCLRCNKRNEVIKFPLCNIFSIQHEYNLDDTQ